MVQIRVTDPAFALPVGALSWFVFDNPGSGVRAAATKAAPGAGFRHVLTGFYVRTLDSTVATANQSVIINFAASGVFTDIVVAYGITAPIGNGLINFSGLNILSPADNLALTCQFLAAGPGTQSQQAGVFGYTVRVS